MAKKIVHRIAAIALGFIVLIVMLEVTLWFLPVTSSMNTLNVNDANPIVRFSPNREYTFSKDWNFSIVNYGHINNYGFINDHDYLRDDSKKMLAVIGDSYIEALMVPFKKTLQGRLQELVANDSQVISLGVSGAQLCQYLHFAEFAKNEFKPESMIFLIVGNDFNQSLHKYNMGISMHQFVEAEGDEFKIKRNDYFSSLTTRLARPLALARYLAHNFKIEALITRMKAAKHLKKQYVGNTKAAVSSQERTDSKRVVQEFFRLLPKYSGLNPSRILFIVDGMRPHLYSEEDFKVAYGSYFDIMRNYFMSSAQEQDYEIIDMQPLFMEHHKKTGERFEYPTDGHWNEIAHGLAARYVRSSNVFNQFLNLPTESN